MIDATLPGISMQPMELMGTGGEADRQRCQADGLLRRRRVPALSLVGERQGLDGRHDASGARARRRRPDRPQPRVGSVAALTARRRSATAFPLSQQQDVRDSLADIYIKTEIQPALRASNSGHVRRRKPKSYEGPQLSYFRKTTGSG